MLLERFPISNEDAFIDARLLASVAERLPAEALIGVELRAVEFAAVELRGEAFPAEELLDGRLIKIKRSILEPGDRAFTFPLLMNSLSSSFAELLYDSAPCRRSAILASMPLASMLDPPVTGIAEPVIVTESDLLRSAAEMIMAADPRIRNTAIAVFIVPHLHATWINCGLNTISTFLFQSLNRLYRPQSQYAPSISILKMAYWPGLEMAVHGPDGGDHVVEYGFL
jgi:hypothetical protein